MVKNDKKQHFMANTHFFRHVQKKQPWQIVVFCSENSFLVINSISVFFYPKIHLQSKLELNRKIISLRWQNAVENGKKWYFTENTHFFLMSSISIFFSCKNTLKTKFLAKLKIGIMKMALCVKIL